MYPIFPSNAMFGDGLDGAQLRCGTVDVMADLAGDVVAGDLG